MTIVVSLYAAGYVIKSLVNNIECSTGILHHFLHKPYKENVFNILVDMNIVMDMHMLITLYDMYYK